MRRSSSLARGSRLPERSTAPPLDQKPLQCSRLAARRGRERELAVAHRERGPAVERAERRAQELTPGEFHW